MQAGVIATRRRFLAALGACLALVLLAGGALRVAAHPERHSLLDPGVYNPGARTYATWLDWTARADGDLAPVWEAAERIEREGWEVELYRPRELEERWAAFVYAPLAAVVLTPLLGLGFERGANVVSVANHLLALLGLGALYSLYARGRRPALLETALFVLLALAFFPLAQALHLTQVGVWIFALLALAAALLDRGRPAAAGALLGVGAFFKPHLLLVPAILALAGRFPRRALAACAAAVVLALTVSLLAAGPGNLGDYVTVQLPRLSAGYAFASNQSFQGWLTRALTNADPSVLELAEPNAPVQWAGRLFALALAIAAAAAGRGRPRGAEADLRLYAAAVAAAVLASPVCWMHHYALLAIPLAVGARALLAAPGTRRGGLDLALLASGVWASVFLDQRGAPRWLSGLELAAGLGLLVCMLILVRRETC